MYLILFLVISVSISYDVRNGVYVLDSDSFPKAIKEFDYLLLDVYAIWCKPCIEFEPQFESLQNMNNGVVLAKIDCADISNQAAMSKYKISFYPTLIMFVKGVPIYFTEERVLEKIEKWIWGVLQKPQATYIQSVAQFEELKDNSEILLVYYPKSDSSGDKSFNAVQETSLTLDEGVVGMFGYILSEELAHKFKLKPGQLNAYRNNKIYSFKNAFTKEKITHFLIKSSSDGLIELSKASQLLFAGQPSFILFTSIEDDGSEEALTAYQTVSKNYQSIYNFFVAKSTNDYTWEFIRANGLDDSIFPQLMAVNTQSNSKYKLDNKPITEKELKQFIQDFKLNKLQRFHKTQEPQPDDEGVKVAVFSNLEDIIYNPEKDVILEVYSHECQFSKDFVPQYIQMAKLLSKNKNIVVAKIDILLNELPFNVQYTPSFYLFKKGKKTPLEFSTEKEKTLMNILDWVKKHSSFPWIDVVTGEEVPNAE